MSVTLNTLVTVSDIVNTLVTVSDIVNTLHGDCQ